MYSPVGSTDGTDAGNLSGVDDGERARRVALSRVVLVLAALAAAALLTLIVVGALTSDMNDEIGQPKFGHIGQQICRRAGA